MSLSAKDAEIGSAASGDESFSSLSRLAVALRFGDIRRFVDDRVEAFDRDDVLIIPSEFRKVSTDM